MKIVKNSTENCHFYSSEKSLYIVWACFRNEIMLNVHLHLILGKILYAFDFDHLCQCTFTEFISISINTSQKGSDY